MALQKLPCGDWVEMPADALAGPQQFRRWYAEHHAPFCQKNPKRIPVKPAVAELRGPQRVIVVRFTEQLNHPQIEIIPERTGATWRVFNKRTQSWPIVHVGDWLVINDLNDVQVISAQAFDEGYSLVETEQPVEPAPKGATVDAGEAARVAGVGSEG